MIKDQGIIFQGEVLKVRQILDEVKSIGIDISNLEKVLSNLIVECSKSIKSGYGITSDGEAEKENEIVKTKTI